MFLCQVYWGQQLKISETVEPLAYGTPLSNISLTTPITCNDVVNYCLSLLSAQAHGEIYNLHAVVVDQNKENNSKRTCQSLAIEMARMFALSSKFIMGCFDERKS